MTWIAKSYAHPTHLVGEEGRQQVEVPGIGWQWRARTVCGRTITGISGESTFQPECRACQKKADR